MAKWQTFNRTYEELKVSFCFVIHVNGPLF